MDVETCSNVIDCEPITDLTVCTMQRDVRATRRRFDWIKKTSTLRSSWQKFKHFFTHRYSDNNCLGTEYDIESSTISDGTGSYICETCQCVCDDRKDSDRFFSLGSATSDIHSNKVVTGVKFVMKNHTMHIQIEQSKLLKWGLISVNKTWKPIEDETYENSDMPKKFELEYLNKRGVFLDDLKSPENHVLTGVRFVTETEDGQTYLKLEIRSTPFDYLEGKLLPEKSIWHSSSVPFHERKHIDISEKEIPYTMMILRGKKNEPLTSGPRYLYFTAVGIMSVDHGDSTIPFIDTQPVYSNPPRPISGLALDHISNEKSAGYLILNLNMYNFASHLN